MGKILKLQYLKTPNVCPETIALPCNSAVKLEFNNGVKQEPCKRKLKSTNCSLCQVSYNVKLSADWSRNKEIGPRLIEQGTNKIFIIPSEARVITKFYWSRVRSEGDQFLYFETRRPIITLLLSLLVEQTRVFP